MPSEQSVRSFMASFKRRLTMYDEAHRELVFIGSKMPEEHSCIEADYREALDDLESFVERIIRKLP